MDDNIRNKYIKVLTHISHYYDKSLEVSITENGGQAFCTNDNRIEIGEELIEKFQENNLPCLSVYYHELSHQLHSKKSFKALEEWKKYKVKTEYNYDEKYLYLDNWIEDYYVDALMVKRYPYLTQAFKNIRRIPLKEDIKHKEMTYHCYYKFGKTYLDPKLDIEFQQYIKTLLYLRGSNKFGSEPVSFNSNIMNSTTLYYKTLVELYNWSIENKILNENLKQPLQNPIMLPQDLSVLNGSYGAFKATVGNLSAKNVMPTIDKDIAEQIFNKELIDESDMFKITGDDLIETQANKDNLDGLFTSTYHIGNVVNTPIIPRFFDQRNFETMSLFKEPNKVFNNVSIYRDISGSVVQPVHALMDNVIQYIIDRLPVEYHFYLYSSGEEADILECPYISWLNLDKVPEEYKSNKTFQQFTYGTNSDAIANIITEQYDDKWLNIICTDGDLDALFNRDNISKLLENCAILFFVRKEFKEQYRKELMERLYKYIKPEQLLTITSREDKNKVVPFLLSFKELC